MIVTRYNRIYGSTTFVDQDNSVYVFPRLADAYPPPNPAERTPISLEQSTSPPLYRRVPGLRLIR